MIIIYPTFWKGMHLFQTHISPRGRLYFVWIHSKMAAQHQHILVLVHNHQNPAESSYLRAAMLNLRNGQWNVGKRLIAIGFTHFTKTDMKVGCYQLLSILLFSHYHVLVNYIFKKRCQQKWLHIVYYIFISLYACVVILNYILWLMYAMKFFNRKQKYNTLLKADSL